MQKVRTFLWYDGQAEAAANHYVSLVPGSRILSVARLGDDGSTVLVTFELGGVEYLALDGGPLYSFTGRPPSWCCARTRRRSTGSGTA
jgi:predicted 3-demethylubiquinone-9 3-methyltransferase (glyoxalase superfamily)